jgi:hypothetical protein
VWYRLITVQMEVNGGWGMLATILLLMAGMAVASGVAVLCGIKAPIETDGEW